MITSGKANYMDIYTITDGLCVRLKVITSGKANYMDIYTITIEHLSCAK